MNYAQFETELRRLKVLQLLSNAQSYTANDALLRQGLKQQGLQVSHDRLRTDVQWLHEQSLVYADFGEHFTVATLTSLGNDVQQGLSSVPGVAKPEPL